MNACTPPGLRLTTWEGVVVLKELIYKFLLWVGFVVLKELIFNSFYFVVVCDSLERTDF